MIVTFKLDDVVGVHDFVEYTNEKASSLTIPVFAMRAETRKINDAEGGSLLLIVNVVVNLPSFYLFGAVLGVAGGLWENKILWLIGLIIATSSVFWSPSFFRFAIKKGLHRRGYLGKIESLTDKKALEVFVLGTE